jgi:uncharacterized membrane protein YdjX (TVP38/TMEM64 family)
VGISKRDDGGALLPAVARGLVPDQQNLFGLNPHWFHLTTVMAHVLATALAFLIARKLLLDAGGALLAAAIFGLHPMQVESVSWISAVNDPLAAVFCFTSFLACKKARSTEQRAALW